MYNGDKDGRVSKRWKPNILQQLPSHCAEDMCKIIYYTHKVHKVSDTKPQKLSNK